jgi:uncharacterized secreted protein with C-terminal beta-propeller domain
MRGMCIAQLCHTFLHALSIHTYTYKGSTTTKYQLIVTRSRCSNSRTRVTEQTWEDANKHVVGIDSQTICKTQNSQHYDYGIRHKE